MELRKVFEATPDLRIVWVMSDVQVNERTRIFVDELGLAKRILFLSDPKSALIQRLGILNQQPEPIEEGVPHPTTLLLDETGTIRFVDVRRDYHIWLDPSLLEAELAALERAPDPG